MPPALHDAASRGDRATLGNLLRRDPALLNSRDDAGRSLMHLAVAASAATVKYLLGLWGADELLFAADSERNTPLHLCVGPRDVWLLLLHGGALTPDVDAKNAAGLGVAECAAHAAGIDVERARQSIAEMLDEEALPGRDRRLFSFLSRSTLRLPPFDGGQDCERWWGTRTPWRQLLLAGAAWPLLLLACAVPVRCSVWWASVCIIVALGALYMYRYRRRPSRPTPRVGRGGPTVAPPAQSATLPALWLFVLISGIVAVDLAALPAAAGRTPLVAGVWLLATIAMYTSYSITVSADPGVLRPGAVDVSVGGAATAAASARMYWEALENDAPDAELDGILDRRFCSRTELARPERARYSPMAGGLVACMDHDCVWVDRAIGEGNHRAFVAFLLAALVVIVLPLVTALNTMLASTNRPRDAWLQALPALHEPTWRRLVYLVAILKVGLLIYVASLVSSQWRGIRWNVTAVEGLDWAKARPGQPFPGRGVGDPGWAGFAPHDEGIVRNVRSFASRSRGEAGS